MDNRVVITISMFCAAFAVSTSTAVEAHDKPAEGKLQAKSAVKHQAAKSAKGKTITPQQHDQFDALLQKEHKASHDLMELGMSDEDHGALHKELDAKHKAFHRRMQETSSKSK